MKPLRLLLFGSVLAGAFAANATVADDLRQEVETLNARWNAAFNRGDVDALTAMYTADAIVMPPNRTLTSPAQIRSLWRDQVISGYREFRIEVVDVRQEGNLIYEVGVWSATASTPNGAERHYGGNLVNIFERQADGVLKSRLHTWN
jgi:ketosteroid isomerase-like protein